jgi:diguanylate cyclase (GGDEF)-like protein
MKLADRPTLALSSIQILMVEDNPGDARLVQELLRDEAPDRFSLRHVASIEQAQQMIEQEHFDAVLLDLSLPDSQGMESLEALQSLARDMPIIILSGNDDEVLAKETFVRGAQDYLLKGRVDGYWLNYCLQSAISRHKVRMLLRDMSSIDELTGLLNRRGFLAYAKQELKLSGRDNRQLAVLFMDMDGLKRINDTHGHLMGDRALRDMAQLLKQSFRDSDVIARIGGDEFAVLVAEEQSNCFAHPIERLQRSMQTYNLTHPASSLAFSYGEAHYERGKPQAIEELLAQADKLMYAQKNRKKLSVVENSVMA